MQRLCRCGEQRTAARLAPAFRWIARSERRTDEIDRRGYCRHNMWFAGERAIAEQPQALCNLVVDGKTYIIGLCDFEVIDPDGSFTITGKVHFAYFTVKGNAADATWNRDPNRSTRNRLWERSLVRARAGRTHRRFSSGLVGRRQCVSDRVGIHACNRRLCRRGSWSRGEG